MSPTNDQNGVVLWPRWASMLTLTLSGLGGLLALIVLVQGVRESIASGLVQAWFASAFAMVMIAGAAMGVLVALRRIRGAEPLTLLCIGGVFFVGAVLTDASIAARALGRPANSPVFVGMDMRWIMLALLALGVLMMGLSAVTTIARDRRASVPSVAKGLAWGVPVVAMAAAWKSAPARSTILAMPGWALAILALFAMVLLVVSASASVHYLVKGFAAAAHTRRAPEAKPGAGTGGQGSGNRRVAGATPMEGGAPAAQQ